MAISTSGRVLLAKARGKWFPASTGEFVIGRTDHRLYNTDNVADDKSTVQWLSSYSCAVILEV
jgi:hypothetical protein